MKKWLSLSTKDLSLFSSAGFHWVILGVAIPLLWVHLSQFSMGGYTYPVTPLAKGADLSTFLDAAWSLRHGTNPYADIATLPKSPLNMALFIPLTYLPTFDSIFVVYQLLTLVTVIATIALLAHWAGFGFWAMFSVIAVTVCTNPFQLHYDRGQMDAFSIAAAVFGGYLAHRSRIGWALFFAVAAVQLKPNAMALILPLLITSDLTTTLKRSGAFFGILAASFLVTPGLSVDYFSSLVGRSQWLINGNNGSLYRLFASIPLGEYLAPLFLFAVAAVLVTGVYRLHQTPNGTPILTGFYLMLPLSLSYPATNFLYCYVFISSLIFFYCPDELTPSPRLKYARLLGCAGVAIALFPVGFIYARYDEIGWFVVPPLGLFLMLMANGVIAHTANRKAPTTEFVPSAVAP